MVMIQVPPRRSPPTDVYWLRNLTTPVDYTPIQETYRRWKTWILKQGDYHDPIDPLHTTLNATTVHDEIYQEAWEQDMEGTSRSCTYREIYLGPEGVAAATLLDDNIDPWFQMTTPHLTLAVARHHEAKNLGPMIARARAVQEWTPTDNPAIHVNPSREFIRISFPDTTAKCVAEHVERERTPEPPTPPEREPEDPEVKAMLDSLPSSLWATGPYDMGYTPQHKIRIPLKPGATTIYRVQYKVKEEAETGITKTIEGLKEAGVLRPSNSPWNTPILPVKKADGLTWRMAHDLRAINDVTEGPPETVPNPQVALHGVTPDHQWFTCIDLANAFFCLPLDEASQPLFAFTWKGEHLTYTRMPQGYRSTPTIFNDCVRRDLKDLPLPDNVTIIQYVDDLLIAATTKEDCMEATKRLLERVAQAGYKVKRAKLQPVQQRVVFLGRTLGPDQREMTQAAKETILAYPRPETVQQLLGFLGLANYSRQYLPEFTEKTAELRQLINTAGTKNLQARLQWTTTADTAFSELKQALHSAAELQAPDYTVPFHLDVSQKGIYVAATLWQPKNGKRRVLHYHSGTLPVPDRGLPPCARHLGAITQALQKTLHVTMHNPTVVHTSHGVKAAVEASRFTLTTAVAWQRLSDTLLAPNITYSNEGVNMADPYPTQNDGSPHNCNEHIEKELKIRPDLGGSPQQEPKEVWYTDGCCYKDPTGANVASWAVVQQEDSGLCHTLFSGLLPDHPSAQRAELMAMVRALENAEDKVVDVYTDSNYVYEMCHVNGSKAERRGMTTSTGKPLKHQDLVLRLLIAIHLPRQVSVIKCQGHTKGDSLVTQGNNAADEAAKHAGGYVQSPSLQLSFMEPIEGEPGEGCTRMKHYHLAIQEMQQAAGIYEQNVWIQRGCQKDDLGIFRTTTTGKPALSTKTLLVMIKSHHSIGHRGPRATIEAISPDWFHPEMEAIVRQHIHDCQTCQAHNPRKSQKPPRGHFPVPPLPFQELCIDYTDMGKDNRVGGYRYLLVIVDRFSRWVEAFPTKHEDAQTVVKHLLNDIIPRWGYPKTVASDNGSHFANKLLEELEHALGLNHRFGSAYHPQSQGIVERANRSIKGAIAKVIDAGQLPEAIFLSVEIGKLTNGKKMSWLQALPLALMSIRSQPNSRTGYSPYELVTGRPMSGPHSPPIGAMTDHLDEILLEYVQALTLASQALFTQVTTPPPQVTQSAPLTYLVTTYTSRSTRGRHSNHGGQVPIRYFWPPPSLSPC